MGFHLRTGFVVTASLEIPRVLDKRSLAGHSGMFLEIIFLSVSCGLDFFLLSVLKPGPTIASMKNHFRLNRWHQSVAA